MDARATMTDHDDALSDSGWVELGSAYTNVTAEPAHDAVRLSVESGAMVTVDLARPQVDELIRMLVVARAEAWPVEGYDGDDDFEVREITL